MIMEKLSRKDIIRNEEYLKEREQRRKRIIDLKKLRRVEVGQQLSFTFENRETVQYQIQEMMRVEKISDEEKIRHEIEVYNDLIPEPGSLSATMFIEIPEMDKVKTSLDRFQGLDGEKTVYLSIDDKPSYAQFEPGHSKEDRISAVHYVKFPLTPDQIRNFKNADVELRVDHPAYKASTKLTAEQKEELAKDLNATES
jgi:hypothetical protein